MKRRAFVKRLGSLALFPSLAIADQTKRKPYKVVKGETFYLYEPLISEGIDYIGCTFIQAVPFAGFIVTVNSGSMTNSTVIAHKDSPKILWDFHVYMSTRAEPAA